MCISALDIQTQRNDPSSTNLTNLACHISKVLIIFVYNGCTIWHKIK